MRGGSGGWWARDAPVQPPLVIVVNRFTRVTRAVLLQERGDRGEGRIPAPELRAAYCCGVLRELPPVQHLGGNR